MKKSIKYLSFIAIIALSACGGDGPSTPSVDETAPIIEIVSPNSETTVTPGRLLNIEANLSDNVDLEDYSVGINFKSDLKSLKTVEEFSFDSRTGKDAAGNNLPAINGENSLNIKFDIELPAFSKSGIYTLSISTIDSSGNESAESVDFQIKTE